jgi:hypothetical protein
MNDRRDSQQSFERRMTYGIVGLWRYVQISSINSHEEDVSAL